MIEFPCWGCGKTLKAKEEHAGKKCKCTGCDRENHIPGTADGVPVAAEDVKGAEPEEMAEPAPVADARAVIRSVEASRRFPTYENSFSEWRKMGDAFRMILLAIIIFVMVNSIVSLKIYISMDCTVPKYENEVANRVEGYPRVFNSVEAQRQNAGILGHGIVAGICIGLLFLLRRGLPIHPASQAYPSGVAG